MVVNTNSCASLSGILLVVSAYAKLSNPNPWTIACTTGARSSPRAAASTSGWRTCGKMPALDIAPDFGSSSRNGMEFPSLRRGVSPGRSYRSTIEAWAQRTPRSVPQPLPHPTHQPFDGSKGRLVGHLPALGDEVTQVQVGQA